MKRISDQSWLPCVFKNAVLAAMLAPGVCGAVVVDFDVPTYSTGALIPQDGWVNGNSVGGQFLDATVDATAGTLTYSGAGGAATVGRLTDALVGAGIQEESFTLVVDFQFTLADTSSQVLNLGFNDNQFRPSNPDRLITVIDLSQGLFQADSPNSGSTPLTGLFTANGATTGQLSDRLRLTREWVVGSTTDPSVANDWSTHWSLMNLDTGSSLINNTQMNVGISTGGNWLGYDSGGVVPVLWGPAFSAGQPVNTTLTIDRLEYFTELPQPPDDNFRLNVDTQSGTVEMRNGTFNAYDIDYYEIRSDAGSLSTSGWLSLDDQNIDAVDGPDPGNTPGDSLGEGWDEAPNSDPHLLSEVFLTGSTLFGADSTLSLGNAFVPGGTRDLVFKLGLTDGTLLTGDIVYTPDINADFNGDGSLNCPDIDMLVAELAANGSDLLFDLTGDGQVTLADLDSWLAEAGAANLPSGNAHLHGDANLDGVVDGSDFIIWNNNKFSSLAAWCAGDFNADGTIDGQDFLVWNNNKFTSADGLEAVPEPATALVLSLIVAVSLGRHRLMSAAEGPTAGPFEKCI